MQIVTVVGGPVRLSPGTLVGLNEDQVATRGRSLKPRGDVFEVLETIELKVGETFQVDPDEISPAMRGRVSVEEMAVEPEQTDVALDDPDAAFVQPRRRRKA